MIPKEKERETHASSPPRGNPAPAINTPSPTVTFAQSPRRFQEVEEEGSDPEEVQSQPQQGSDEEEGENSNSFHKFWTAVERLVQRLPAGVAFTMAQQPHSGSGAGGKDFSNPMSNSILLDSYYVVPPSEAEVK